MSQSQRLASRGKIEVGFDGLDGDTGDNAELGCNDDVDWRIQMCMIGEAACDGIVMQSKRSRMARAARTFSWSCVKTDGVEQNMPRASDPLTERRAGIAAEKTKDRPLMR